MFDQRPSATPHSAANERAELRRVRGSLGLVVVGGVCEAVAAAYLVGLFGQMGIVAKTVDDAMAAAWMAIVDAGHALVHSDALIVLPALLAVVIAVYIAAVIAANGSVAALARTLQGAKLAEFMAATSVAVLTLCVVGAVAFRSESTHLLAIVVLTSATTLAGVAVSTAVRGTPEQRVRVADGVVAQLKQRRSSLPNKAADADRPVCALVAVFAVLVLAWYVWAWVVAGKMLSDPIKMLLPSAAFAVWTLLSAGIPVFWSFAIGDPSASMRRRRVWVAFEQLAMSGFLLAGVIAAVAADLKNWLSLPLGIAIIAAAIVSAHAPIGASTPGARFGRFARVQLGPAITALIRGRLMAQIKRWRGERQAAAYEIASRTDQI